MAAAAHCSSSWRRPPGGWATSTCLRVSTWTPARCPSRRSSPTWCCPLANTLTLLGVLVAMASAVVRHRRADRRRARPHPVAAVVGGGAVAVALAPCPCCSDFGVVTNIVFFVVVVAACRRDDDRHRPARRSSRCEDLLEPHPGVRAAVAVPGRRRPRSSSPPSTQCSPTPSTSARSCVVVLLLTVAALRTAPAAAAPPRCAGWSSASATAPYDVVAGLASTLETRRRGRRAAGRGRRMRWRRRSGSGSCGVEVERGDWRAAGRHVRRATRPRSARCRSPTATQEVGRVVLPARGLRSRLTRRDERLLGDLVRQAATAARTSRLAERAPGQPRAAGRRPRGGAPPDPPRPPRRPRAVAERRRLPARVGAAAGRQGAGRRQGDQRIAISDARAGGRGRRAPPGPRPAPAGARRPRAGRRAAPAGRPVRHRRPTVSRGRRPRCAARGGRGGGVPDRQRGADQRRYATPAHRRVRRLARRRRRRAARRGRRRRRSGSRRTRRSASVWSRLRERAAELGGRSEVTCPAAGRHGRASLAAR